MKPEEIIFTGSDGATTLYASVWEPEGECRGTVQICHGMSEHIGRYRWLAEQLTAHGYRVCGDDHLGHGRTAQREEDLGYFGAKDGWKHLIEDEHLLFGIMRQRMPEQPYFLLGHSMGSFITRAYITRFGEELNGYICCGTSGRNPLVKPARVMAALVSVFSGPKKTGKFLDRMAFRDYNSRYENVVTGHEWLSRDQAVYAEFAGDPKSGFVFKNAGFRDLFHLLDSVTGRKWSDRIPKGLPILLLSGDADPVGQYGEGVKEVYGWIRESGVKDVQLKLYPDARHELHNELCREEFAGDVIAFLEAHR